MGETAGITQDVGMDPTVGDSSAIPPMCTMCGEEIVCETCGEAMEDGYVCLEVDAEPRIKAVESSSDQPAQDGAADEPDDKNT